MHTPFPRHSRASTQIPQLCPRRLLPTFSQHLLSLCDGWRKSPPRTRSILQSSPHTEFDFSQCPGLHQNHPMQARARKKYGRLSSVIRARASRAGPRGATRKLRCCCWWTSSCDASTDPALVLRLCSSCASEGRYRDYRAARAFACHASTDSVSL